MNFLNYFLMTIKTGILSILHETTQKKKISLEILHCITLHVVYSSRADLNSFWEIDNQMVKIKVKIFIKKQKNKMKIT